MHVPWGWIKQRPHFIAEGLCEKFNIEVVYKKAIRLKKRELKQSLNTNFSISGFISIPFAKIPILRHLSFLNFINTLLILRIILKFKKVDIIWIPSINIYKLIRRYITPKQTLIYDCMDDEFEFSSLSGREYRLKLDLESELVGRANLIFCSANHLKHVIVKRTGIASDKIKVINNAVEIPKTRNDIENKIDNDILALLRFVEGLDNPIIYIGTIAEWFDFELLRKAANQFNNINFVLIGPSYQDIPQIERVYHIGTVERKYIFKFMEISKALVMPFRVTPLIESVNPVKLYEYIYSGKPVIAPYYEESSYFLPYVNLYHSDVEFIELCNRVITSDTTLVQTKNSRDMFVNDNTWSHRISEIVNCINSKNK